MERKAQNGEEKMAMKFLVTFLLLISIGEIYSKTLLERIRDDSDLSQVSSFRGSFLWGFGSPQLRVVESGNSKLSLDSEGTKLKIFWLLLGSLHNRRKNKVLCNMSECLLEDFVRCHYAMCRCRQSCLLVKT